MSSLHLIAIISLLFGAVLSGIAPKKDTPSEVVIHATNKTSVPSVHYIVDAVECLKEAYAVYAEDGARAQLYAELFQEKHPETTWNVVAGYTAAYLNSQWYVETLVTGGGDKDDDKKDKKDSKKDSDKDKGSSYLIFSTA